MKKYRVYYWKYKNDEWTDLECDVIAENFDLAYKGFKENNRLVKITEIKEIR